MDDGPDAPTRHVTLIGTGHVLDIADKIRGAIQAIRPDTVCVELDRGRLQALHMRRAGQEPPPGGGWIQRKLQTFQEHIAAEYGVRAGDEMLAAVDAGFQTGSRVALIDRPIQLTLQRVTKQITWKEKVRLLGLISGGAIKGLFRRDAAKSTVERELADYNADPVATLAALRDKFPTIYRVLIEERDEWMARRIHAALANGGFVVAVVGDGHVGGMLPLLDGLDVTTYRLPDVQDGKLPALPPDDTTNVSIGFNIGTD